MWDRAGNRVCVGDFGGIREEHEFEKKYDHRSQPESWLHPWFDSIHEIKPKQHKFHVETKF